jgi:hypothetical protein
MNTPPQPFTPPQWAPPRLGAIPHCQGGQWSSHAWIDACWLHPEQMGRAENPCPVAGYAAEAVAHIGIEYGLEIDLWKREGGETDVPPFLLRIVYAGDSTPAEYLSAGSLPDALDLLGRWAPAVTAEVVSTVYRDLASHWPDDTGLVTNILAAARANEDAIGKDVRRITAGRAEARDRWLRQRAERQARQAGGAAALEPWRRS